jgi:hypothetical protein
LNKNSVKININLKPKKMKKLLLISFTFISYIAFSQCVDPVISDFECDPPSNPFSGAITSISNPVSGGINTSANVGQYTDDGTDGWDNLNIDYGTTIDLSTNNILKFKIYAPSSIQVLAKIEGGTAQEIWSDFSAVNTWEEFTFDFSASAGNGNTKVVLFFNADVTTGTASDIYYIDDLEWGAAPTTCVDPILSDFECTLPSQPLTGAITTIANPVSGGINTSANVGEYIDNGTEGFDALTIDYGTAIDLSINNQLKFKIYSPTSIQVLAKLEGGTAQEIWSSSSAVSTWEEFTYDFSASAGNGNTKVVLFFNADVTTGTASDIYYIDDLEWGENPTASANDITLDNALSVSPNPANNNINISSKVVIDGYQLSDITGKIIVSKTNKELNSFTIDISTESSGLYFLTIKSGSSSKTLKVIKE